MNSFNLKEFIKKNFTIYHLIGILVGLGLSLLYWYISGKNSDQILKNNPYLVSLWGMAVGYITFDFVRGAIKRDH
jgi:hypothetical protein